MKKALFVVWKFFTMIFVGTLSAIMWPLYFVGFMIQFIGAIIATLIEYIDEDSGYSIVRIITKLNLSLGFNECGETDE